MRSIAIFVGLASVLAPALGHSWIEQLQRIDPSTGTFLDPPGYRRNHIARSDPNFQDKKAERQLPTSDTANTKRDVSGPSNAHPQGITPNDLLCKSQSNPQLVPFQPPGFPVLQAAPSDYIAIRYLENGHVTKPQVPPRKPAHSGTVYVYLTQTPSNQEKFLDVYGAWTEDGSGGDKRGRLIGTFPFDDGRCYEKNDSPISAQRQQQFPVQTTPLSGPSNACQNDVKLPADLKEGQATLYWIWDWSTEPSAPGGSDGTTEIYTSCADLQITKTPQTSKQARSLEKRTTYENMAIPDQMKAGQGQASSPPAQSSAPQSAAPAAPAAAQPSQAAQASSQAQVQAPASAATTNAASIQSASQAAAPSIDITSLAAAVAAELAKHEKQTKTVTVTQTAAACASVAAAPSAGDSVSQPAVASNPVATAMPSQMEFASPIMAPTGTASAAPQMQTSASPGSSQDAPAQVAPVAASSPSQDTTSSASNATPTTSEPPQAQTATPASISQSGAVQAGAGSEQKQKRTCSKCQRRSRLF